MMEQQQLAGIPSKNAALCCEVGAILGCKLGTFTPNRQQMHKSEACKKCDDLAEAHTMNLLLVSI
jgi:hypothetical protein